MALDGLFHGLGEEERKLRTNPGARVTDLLNEVFGKQRNGWRTRVRASCLGPCFRPRMALASLGRTSRIVPGELLLLVPVVAGVLRDPAGRILLARRHPHSRHGGLWEFPGGKIEPGETPEGALARELLEELGIRVSVGTAVLRVEHVYPHAAIELTAFACRLEQGTPEPIDCWEVAWVEAGALLSYDMPEADVPIARLLAARCFREE
jgi:8-oxo-dGTP diphosphatase